MFIGRKDELAVLETGYGSAVSELCVVYGRRRIGKSTLLAHFARGKHAFIFIGGREAKRLQLQRFVRELGDACGDALIGRTVVEEWHEALTLLDRNLAVLRQRGGERKALIVLDEFQWMCTGCPELLSDLQRLWDTRWKMSGEISLVLCGSSVSFMLGEVLSHKSPLFGRRTRSFKLEPFRLPDAAPFFPRRGRFDVAEAYLAVGGIPKYLEVLGGGTSVRRSLARESFSPAGYFFDEVRFVLSEQLRETEQYFRLLEELAAQPRGVRELEERTGISSGQVMFYLERLQTLDFVSRHNPVSSARTTRKVRYRLEDYYLRLYFKYIHPQRRRIARTSGNLTFQEAVGSTWDAYAGTAFEQCVREHADVVAMRAGHGDRILAVGSYWQKPTARKRGVQIDVVIQCEDRTTLICECKWGRGKTGSDASAALRRQVGDYPNLEQNTVEPVLIAAGGASAAVHKEKDILVLSLDDFFA